MCFHPELHIKMYVVVNGQHVRVFSHRSMQEMSQGFLLTTGQSVIPMKLLMECGPGQRIFSKFDPLVSLIECPTAGCLKMYAMQPLNFRVKICSPLQIILDWIRKHLKMVHVISWIIDRNITTSLH